ncbi:MAG: hypothetical protein KatS3mg111_1665 [Pirellulaceae bacterium]|nr:MAG: hypothetical protein KatS3mg111_1665 [Pirellulaceae bacterium]
MPSPAESILTMRDSAQEQHPATFDNRCLHFNARSPRGRSPNKLRNQPVPEGQDKKTSGNMQAIAFLASVNCPQFRCASILRAGVAVQAEFARWADRDVLLKAPPDKGDMVNPLSMLVSRRWQAEAIGRGPARR